MARLSAADLTRIHDQLTWIVQEIGRCQAEVGVPSAHTRIDAARRRAVVLIDSVIEGLPGRDNAAPPIRPEGQTAGPR